jgi:hypothetical protein
MIRTARIAAFAAVALFAVTSAAHASVHVWVGIGAPPPPPAVVAPAPVVVAPPPAAYGYVWRPAYTVWTGYGYQMVPGGWVRPPHAHAVWVAPHWAAQHRGYVWTDGYWRH